MVTQSKGRGACMVCPVCHSCDIEFTDEDFSDEETEIHHLSCDGCGAKITETWKATSWQVSPIEGEEEEMVDEDCEICKFQDDVQTMTTDQLWQYHDLARSELFRRGEIVDTSEGEEGDHAHFPVAKPQANRRFHA